MKNKPLMKTLSAILAVVMVLCSAPLSGFVGLEFPEIKLPEWNLFDFSVLAEAKTYSGTCGENITWSIDSETGVLDITGTGDMPYFSSSESVPWSLYRLLAKTVNISEGITSISEYAFYDFANLVDVNIPDSVTSIGYYAFYGCASLKTIIIPSGVTYIGTAALQSCSSLEEIIVDTDNKNYSSDDYGALYDKDKTSLHKYPVANKITEFKIPNSVTVIENEAFANSIYLKKVIIPDSAISVGSSVFYNCTGLKELTMPVSLEWKRYDGLFYNCTNIEKVTLTKGTGRMPYYSSSYYDDTYYQEAPWYISRDTIKEIVIEDGVENIGSYAFYGCTNLKSIVIPSTVTYISYNAFCCCENLNSITLNEGITYIDSYAFQACTSLESIIIPDSVTGIGDGAFYDCTNLKSVTIPESVKNIWSSAFGNCRNLENVYYTGDIAAWCSIAFDYESSNPLCFAENFYINNVLQTDLVIPDSIVEIKDYAFYGYDGLNTVTFSDEIISINDYAFYGCSNFTTVTLPDSIMKIGENAFGSCSALSTVYYDGTTEQWQYKEIGTGNNNLTKNILFANDSDRPYYTGDCGENLKWTLYTDGELVISGNGEMFNYYNIEEVPWYEKIYQIKKITIENGVTSIGYKAFAGLVNLEKVVIANSVETIGGFAFGNCVVLNEIIIPEAVTTIGEGAFVGCNELSKIKLSDNLESIGAVVFRACVSLVEITLPEKIIAIGECAFQNCTSLTEITIPDSVVHINPSAFNGCIGLKKVVLGKGLTSFDNAFENLTNLEQVEIPEGITSIGYRTFYNCTSLKKIIIPNSVITIGTDAFYGCTGLEELTMPASAKTYYNNGFGNCTNIEKLTLTKGTGVMPDFTNGSPPWYEIRNTIREIVIEDGVTNISDYVFQICVNLVSIDIPDSVTSIGVAAFHGCSSLGTIDIPDSVTSIGQYAFYGCSSLVSIDIPNGIETIDNSVFRECSSLKTVNIPNSVTSIGISAFRECSSLESIVIPEGITAIDNYTFYNCSALDSVSFSESITSIGQYAFYGCSSLDTIDIPDNVTSIGQYAFGNCSSFSSIDIPNSVMTVGASAFRGCSNLESVTITDSIISIGEYVLDGCPKLISVFYSGTYEQWDKIEIESNNANLTTKVVFDSDSDRPYCAGECGKNLIWFLYVDGELVISGNGAMADYYYVTAPWYERRAQIKEVTIGQGVTRVGDQAFRNCTNLKSIIIPNNVTEIGSDILMGATSLESLMIPFIGKNQNNKSSIRNYVFGYNIPKTLKTINITNATSIGNYAFEDCENVETITLNKGIKTIGVRAFANCTELKAITIPDSVENIQDSAFYNCSSMKTVNLGNNANMSMDYDIFNGCNSLESFTIGSSNVNYCTDANGVLYNKNKTGLIRYPAASSMTEYTIAPTTAYINEFAFENSYNLKKVNFPENMMSIGAYAFKNCTDLEEINIPDGANTICNNAFYGCSSVKKVILPESLFILGGYAFGGCVNLSEVIINCANLEDANSYPFYQCGDKTDGLKVVFTDKVQVIPDKIFLSFNGWIWDKETGEYVYQNSNLKSITIGKNVNSVGELAFYNNANLVELNFNATDCTFEDSAFSSCSSLAEVNIGNNVKRIPEYFVANCNALTDITITESVTEIGKYAFSNCENLENIVFLGKNKIDIGDNIFDYSPKATICCKENSYMHSYADINVIRYCIIDESNNPNYEIKNEVLISYKGNAERIYLNSVNRVGFGAFAENLTLKHIELSSDVARIYDMAFNGCKNLETVIIPKSVTSIGENAFDGCNKLTIYCYADSYAEEYAKKQGIKFEYITLELTESKVEIYSDEVLDLGTAYNIDIVDSEEALWISDNESVVKVAQNGKITAVGEGTATITAKTESGLEAECTVTVNAGKRPAVEGVTVSDFTVSYKGSIKIEPDVKFAGDVDYTVEYTSSNESVATVDEYGNVTATGTGEAEITVTVTDEYGNVVEDTCKVTVSYAWWQWLIIIFLFGWIWY